MFWFVRFVLCHKRPFEVTNNAHNAQKYTVSIEKKSKFSGAQTSPTGEGKIGKYLPVRRGLTPTLDVSDVIEKSFLRLRLVAREMAGATPRRGGGVRIFFFCRLRRKPTNIADNIASDSGVHCEWCNARRLRFVRVPPLPRPMILLSSSSLAFPQELVEWTRFRKSVTVTAANNAATQQPDSALVALADRTAARMSAIFRD